jgi:small subunit ribosomal protein YMR-31
MQCLPLFVVCSSFLFSQLTAIFCITAKVDHTPRPHPEAPTQALPGSFSNGNSHASFSSYRDSAQQHGPLRKAIGAQPGANLGPVEAPRGVFFDRSQLPARFRRAPLDPKEIEAVETGGAALFG